MPELPPNLKKLMNDPRYWDSDHPEHAEMVRKVSAGFEQAQADKPPAAGDEGPSAAWFDAIAEAEKSGKDGWTAWNKPKPGEEGFGALGRYQFRRIALKDAGFIDSNGKWTGKQNVWSIQDFLRIQKRRILRSRTTARRLTGRLKARVLKAVSVKVSKAS